MFTYKLISPKACGPTRSAEHLLVWVYGKQCVLLYVISSSTNHGICAVNFQRSELPKNFSLCAQYAGAHGTSGIHFSAQTAICDCRRKRIRKPEFEPRPHYLGSKTLGSFN